MKRILIILGICCLLLDLTDDGSIGKIKYIAPQNGGHAVAAQYQADDHPNEAVPGTGNMVALLSTHSAGYLGKLYSRQMAVAVPRLSQIMECRHLCSSGGIPL